MKKRKTAGELSLKAASDTTRYDPLEIAHALTEDMAEQLRICAERHCHIFDEDEFCLIFVVAGDPLIQGVRRHKYTAFPFLPKPRPQQSVFLFNRVTHSCKRLWSLPDAKVMATVSEMTYVAPQWQATKFWCDCFFKGNFFESIRLQHGISMLSESEYLNANRAELIKAGGNEIESSRTDPFYFSKVPVQKVVDEYEPVFN